MQEPRIELPPEAPERGKLGQWQTVAIIVATWLVSTAVNWGALQAHQEESMRRQDAADRAIAQQLPRVEFDGWRDELNHRFDRLEQKIDTLLVKR